ncbi:NAD(P)-dependent alcohol dehydrogenase [Paenibacillus sp. 2TAB23]|uniref:NAD(P)-dependent alcohol dehydrogenase n=1 Tax=Paenibacillus sp. 2TAB23 TaxID=3233004 RepID=UPI003F9DBA2F
MKAIICTGYGSPEVLKLREVEKPVPKDNEVLVKVFATTVTSGDCRVRSFKSPVLLWLPMRAVLGFKRPRKPILGVELAGEIEAIGKNVTRFKKGDHVYALTGMRFGGYAEYACLSESGMMAEKPANVIYDEAAALAFGGTTALHFFRKGNIRSGQKVLIYGASGAVGTAAVQLAKHFGAQVTGVCSASNMDLAKSLGAERAIDYTTEDFTKKGEFYDLIFDAVGKLSKAAAKKALAPNGTYVTVEGQGMVKERVEDLLFIKELVEKGELKPVIDRRYSLAETAEAHRYVEQGRKKGNVVITIVQ